VKLASLCSYVHNSNSWWLLWLAVTEDPGGVASTTRHTRDLGESLVN